MSDSTSQRRASACRRFTSSVQGSVEALERRMLLSGAGSVVPAPDGTLTVTGTNAADNIHVALNIIDDGTGPVDVTLNGVDRHLSGQVVKRIPVNGLAGTDAILG